MSLFVPDSFSKLFISDHNGAKIITQLNTLNDKLYLKNTMWGYKFNIGPILYCGTFPVFQLSKTSELDNVQNNQTPGNEKLWCL